MSPISPCLMACSMTAKWQKTNWSGICILKARCDRIFLTVWLISTLPKCSSLRSEMSVVMKVPVNLTFELEITIILVVKISASLVFTFSGVFCLIHLTLKIIVNIKGSITILWTPLPSIKVNCSTVIFFKFKTFHSWRQFMWSCQFVP